MADKLMYIRNDDSQNYRFCRLKLVVETFEHSTYWINQTKLPYSLWYFFASLEYHKSQFKVYIVFTFVFTCKQGKGNVILTNNSKWNFPLNPLPFFLPFLPTSLSVTPTKYKFNSNFTPTKYLIFGNFKSN